MKPEPWESFGREGMGLDLSLHRIPLAVAGGLDHAGAVEMERSGEILIILQVEPTGFTGES